MGPTKDNAAEGALSPGLIMGCRHSVHAEAPITNVKQAAATAPQKKIEIKDNFRQAVHHPHIQPLLLKYLESCHCEELLQFYLAADKIRKSPSKVPYEDIMAIYNEYLEDNAPNVVNLKPSERKINTGETDSSLEKLMVAQQACLIHLKQTRWRLFLNSTYAANISILDDYGYVVRTTSTLVTDDNHEIVTLETEICVDVSKHAPTDLAVALETPDIEADFRRFLSFHFCEELLDFYLEYLAIKPKREDDARKALQKLSDEYLADYAPRLINISPHNRQASARAAADQFADLSAVYADLDAAHKETYNLMRHQFWTHYLKTPSGQQIKFRS